MLHKIGWSVLQQFTTEPEPLGLLCVFESFLMKLVVVNGLLLPTEKLDETEWHQQRTNVKCLPAERHCQPGLRVGLEESHQHPFFVLALLTNESGLVLRPEFDVAVASEFQLEVLDGLVSLVAEEEHDLQIVAAGMEIVDGAVFHADLQQLIFEENALVLEGVQLVALLLLVGVQKQPQFLTASSH